MTYILSSRGPHSSREDLSACQLDIRMCPSAYRKWVCLIGSGTRPPRNWQTRSRTSPHAESFCITLCVCHSLELSTWYPSLICWSLCWGWWRTDLNKSSINRIFFRVRVREKWMFGVIGRYKKCSLQLPPPRQKNFDGKFEWSWTIYFKTDLGSNKSNKNLQIRLLAILWRL